MTGMTQQAAPMDHSAPQYADRRFDGPDTVYVYARGPQGELHGSARLAPTDRPYRLASDFPQLFNGAEAPRSSEVWELSQFDAVDLRDAGGPELPGVASQLLSDSLRCASARGARKLIIKAPVALERLLGRCGVRVHRAGPPIAIGSALFVACWAVIADL